MKISTNNYAYNARHGEYLPTHYTECWYADFKDNPDEDYVRPEWVTDELVDYGFGADEDGDPEGEFYIRLECDEAGLFEAIKSLFAEIAGGPVGADDDTYDYWPSGKILFEQMGADLSDSGRIAEFKAMEAQLPDPEQEYESESEKIQPANPKDIERRVYRDLGLLEPGDLENE